jgi:ketosteroid isomerase-like protein
VDSRSVVASFFACWRVQDLEMALGHLHPDIVYTLHNGPDASPFSGSFHGIDSCRDLGYTVLAEFDYLAYEPTTLNVEGPIVQAHVFSRLQHRATGHLIEGSQRSVFQVRDGLVARIDIYEDGPRIEAFMRMTAQRMMKDRPAPVPTIPWPEKQGSTR